MPRIRCHYTDCAFIQNNYCNATSTELDPDEGCMTYITDIETDSDPGTDPIDYEDEDDEVLDLYEDEDDEDDEDDFEWSDEEDDIF